MLAQISTSYFCAGLILKEEVCIKAAPIIKYMIGWNRCKIREYCIKKNYKIIIIDNE